MEGMVPFSRVTVVKKPGVFVRLETIRTEVKPTNHMPLIAYQDMDAIATFVEPRSQVLMFFARMRKPYKWDSPRRADTGVKYRKMRRIKKMEKMKKKKKKKKKKEKKKKKKKKRKRKRKKKKKKIEKKIKK
ncbi:hypothetical protein MBLNU459_g5535t1 [Dothideomycetes sp. NU459]